MDASIPQSMSEGIDYFFTIAMCWQRILKGKCFTRLKGVQYNTVHPGGIRKRQQGQSNIRKLPVSSSFPASLWQPRIAPKEPTLTKAPSPIINLYNQFEKYVRPIDMRSEERSSTATLWLQISNFFKNYFGLLVKREPWDGAKLSRAQNCLRSAYKGNEILGIF